MIVGRGIVLRDRGRSFGAEELRETQFARGGPVGRLLRSGGGCSDGGRVRGRNLGCDDRNRGRADALLLTRLTTREGRDAEVDARVGARKVMDDGRNSGTRQRCDVRGGGRLLGCLDRFGDLDGFLDGLRGGRGRVGDRRVLDARHVGGDDRRRAGVADVPQLLAGEGWCCRLLGCAHSLLR